MCPDCDLQSTLMLLFVLSTNRGESVESFPGLSRNSSRTTERDWDNGSTASSVTSTSMAEYTGEFFTFHSVGSKWFIFVLRLNSCWCHVLNYLNFFRFLCTRTTSYIKNRSMLLISSRPCISQYVLEHIHVLLVQTLVDEFVL